MENVSAVAAAVAAAIAGLALYYARLTAKAAQGQVAAAQEQTRLQNQVRTDAAQPYVWVDIRPSDEHGQMLMLYLGNSGPTVATDVRVVFDPPLAFPGPASRCEDAVEQLSRGIPSLPPGRTMQWRLGVAVQQIEAADPAGYQIQVTASGPFGPTEPLAYRLDVRAFLATPLTAPGTLYGIAASIDKLTKATTEHRK